MDNTVVVIKQDKRQNPELLATLLPYQEEAVEWCINHEDKCCILAYDMGLGKTVITCALLAKKPMKTLIMLPTSLIKQWEYEINHHTTGINVVIYHGSNRKYRKFREAIKTADVILSTTAVIGNDIKLGCYKKIFKGVERWVIDEAHKLRNKKNKIYKCLELEAPFIDNKIFLTGTPICNSSNDLISLIELSNIDNEKWKKCEDINKYTLLKSIIPDILLRKKKSDVLNDMLPSITEHFHKLSITDETQKNIYNYYTGYSEILKKIMRLRQSLNSHTQLLQNLQEDELIDFQNSNINENLPVKIKKIQEIVNFIPDGEKVIIFSVFTQLLEQIYELLNCPDGINKTEYIQIYHGGQSISEKNDIINNFKNNRNTKILLINLRAGGVGLNLVEANHVILVEPYWNDAEQQQAITRVYRIGQKKSVNVHKLYIQNTIESWLISLQKSKKNISNYLIDKNNLAADEIINKQENVKELFRQINNVCISDNEEDNKKITEIVNQFGL